MLSDLLTVVTSIRLFQSAPHVTYMEVHEMNIKVIIIYGLTRCSPRVPSPSLYHHTSPMLLVCLNVVYQPNTSKYSPSPSSLCRSASRTRPAYSRCPYRERRQWRWSKMCSSQPPSATSKQATPCSYRSSPRTAWTLRPSPSDGTRDTQTAVSLLYSTPSEGLGRQIYQIDIYIV